MKPTPQELILSTKIDLRLIDLDLSPELMGHIKEYNLCSYKIPYNSSDNIFFSLVYYIILSWITVTS